MPKNSPKARACNAKQMSLSSVKRTTSPALNSENRISLLVHRDICRYKHTRILDCERKQTLKLVCAVIGFSFVQLRTSPFLASGRYCGYRTRDVTMFTYFMLERVVNLVNGKLNCGLT